jgi:hypothetical protein
MNKLKAVLVLIGISLLVIGAGYGKECTIDSDCPTDNNQCTTDKCNRGGNCVYEPTPNADCNDGNACTTNDKCDGQAKCVGTAVVCTDEECKDFSCNPDNGQCDIVTNPGGSCDDENLCTNADTCVGIGVCAGTDVVCTDAMCDDKECNPDNGECETVGVGDEPCSDDDLCTYDDTCVDIGDCQGTAKICEDTDCWNLECDGTDTCAKTIEECEDAPCLRCDDSGACTAPGVGQPHMMCDGACVNTQNDDLNCGKCENPCDTAKGYKCAAGVCKAPNAGNNPKGKK